MIIKDLKIFCQSLQSSLSGVIVDTKTMQKVVDNMESMMAKRERLIQRLNRRLYEIEAHLPGLKIIEDEPEPKANKLKMESDLD